jgi:hypothetical protein
MHDVKHIVHSIKEEEEGGAELGHVIKFLYD